MSQRPQKQRLNEKEPAEVFGCLLVLAGIAYLVAKVSGLI